MTTVLDATYHRLCDLIDTTGLYIQDIMLRQFEKDCPCNILRLSDGSVGACMNYHLFNSQDECDEATAMILRKIEDDPLLLKYLFDDPSPDLFKLGLKVCVISALSRKIILRSPLFSWTREADWSFISDVRSATVIGLGGYLHGLITDSPVRQIHVSDLGYGSSFENTHRMEKQISAYRASFPEKNISISNGSDNEQRIGSSDLVTITGSALCNGSMDELLYYAGACKHVVVQGQSASVFPLELFERGVTFISTTIKPHGLMDIAREDFSLFRRALEGGLPSIYIYPIRQT